MITAAKNEEGQAFFELIVFLPFMIFLFVILVNFGNSINGAINQQKVLRGTFFHILMHDSFAPTQDDLNQLNEIKGIRFNGMTSLGWTEKGAEGDDTTQEATCYKVPRLFGGDPTQECTDADIDESSDFIKIFTFYGLCSVYYDTRNQDLASTLLNHSVSSLASCQVQQ